MRKEVQAVGELLRAGAEGVSVAQVAKHLDIHKVPVGRATNTACAHGWLVKHETRKGYPARLVLGEPLPERMGLPTPESLENCNSVTADTGGSPAANPVFEEVF